MGRDDDIDVSRRRLAAGRLAGLLDTVPSMRDPGWAMTHQEFGELIGVNQTTVGRYLREIDPKTGGLSTMYGAFGARAAIVMSALHTKTMIDVGTPDAALPIEWWLGVDYVIDAWPDPAVRKTLKDIHPDLSARV